ncbi:MAG: CoA-binding protein [Streptococcaceae bacterium]|jgi:predicted CoA-binding protein|nr:CoA-binding protein [Streptococcaceae bacterium]
MTFTNPNEQVIFGYLKEAKRIAVVGMSDKDTRSSFLVARELQKAGYEIVPVNPVLAGQKILGETVYASLSEIPGHIDLVDIFRRSEFLPDLAREFLTIDADVFWAQQGIYNDEAAEILIGSGHQKIVMDRCTKVELMRMSWQN